MAPAALPRGALVAAGLGAAFLGCTAAARRRALIPEPTLSAAAEGAEATSRPLWRATTRYPEFKAAHEPMLRRARVVP